MILDVQNVAKTEQRISVYFPDCLYLILTEFVTNKTPVLVYHDHPNSKLYLGI